MKEKTIETAIVNHILSKWCWCEALQSWSIMIKKWPYSNKMNLCSNWTPDIIALNNWTLYAIEVKKDQSEVDKWYRLEKRYNNEQTLPKTYSREISQIEHKKLIIKNWWKHIVTADLLEVIEFLGI